MIHVTANSKEVRPGSIFFALKGARFDGHQFINDAFQAGAKTVYAEYDTGDARVTVLGAGTRKKLAELASEMHGHPTHQLKMIGITGTSGKTTTSYLVQHVIREGAKLDGNPQNGRCARIGTNGGEFEGRTWNTINTTPDAISLQQWFREVLDLGATHVVMEVSSHALDQDRAWAIAWDSVVFLNLSPEHMDYHPTLDAYFEAKALLLTTHLEYSRKVGKSPIAFANSGVAYGQKLITQDPRIQGYSVKNDVRDLVNTATGIAASVKVNYEWYSIECPLFGDFQIENILAALNVGASLGIGNFWAGLPSFPGVPGRMEFIPNRKGIFCFVDYAHKPEALEKVLLAIQGKKIITVFGCGGDRDRTKRPVMGEIATRLSSHVMVTSDNPRTEDANAILAEIVGGITASGRKNFEVIADREQAIARAASMATTGDIILIAGKGHEDYQILPDGKGGTYKVHFDDREMARQYLDI
jgi:UDP-N-acetylmuramoyl-L-alanyl-D-glutamate--2,6-diaminopimelate ligase